MAFCDSGGGSGGGGDTGLSGTHVPFSVCSLLSQFSQMTSICGMLNPMPGAIVLYAVAVTVAEFVSEPERLHIEYHTTFVSPEHPERDCVALISKGVWIL